MEELRREFALRLAAIEAAALARWADANEVSVGDEQDDDPAELDRQRIEMRRRLAHMWRYEEKEDEAMLNPVEWGIYLTSRGYDRDITPVALQAAVLETEGVSITLSEADEIISCLPDYSDPYWDDEAAE